MSRVPWHVRAVLVAAALAALFALRGFVSFEGLRVKLVRDPVAVTAGTIAIPGSVDARTASLRAPVALIAVIGNPDPAPRTFLVLVDGRQVCATAVPGGSTRRLDCAVSELWPSTAPPVIALTGDTAAWTLEYLEAATHHGSSNRLVRFYVLPSTSTHPVRPGWFGVVLMFLAVAGVYSLPRSALPRWATWAHRAAVGGVTLGLAAAALSPLVSPFLLALPLRSFVVIAAILCAPQLAAATTTVFVWARRMAATPALRRPAVVTVVVALVVMLPYAMVVKHSASEFHGDYSGIVRISKTWFDRSPLFAAHPEIRDAVTLQPDDGYDAQFAYFALFDPLMRSYQDRPVMYRAVADAPPYRFGRIGFPWLVRLLAGSQWRWYPVVMVGLVLLGVGLCAGTVAWLAQRAGRTAWWGLLMLAVPGFWQSIRMALPEPIAAGTLLLGCCFILTRRFRTAALCFAASLLIRETGLLLLVSLLLFLPATVATRRDRLWLAAAIVPLVLWRTYVAVVLWPDWGWEGLLYSADNVGAPLMGIVHLWAALAHGTYHPGIGELTRAATWYPVVLIVVAGVAWTLRRALPKPVALALMGYVVLSLSLTFPVIWGHVGNAQRGSYEMFVVLAAGSVSVPHLSGSDRAALIAATVLGLAFVLFGAHDAITVREALFP